MSAPLVATRGYAVDRIDTNVYTMCAGVGHEYAMRNVLRYNVPE